MEIVEETLLFPYFFVPLSWKRFCSATRSQARIFFIWLRFWSTHVCLIIWVIEPHYSQFRIFTSNCLYFFANALSFTIADSRPRRQGATQCFWPGYVTITCIKHKIANKLLANIRYIKHRSRIFNKYHSLLPNSSLSSLYRQGSFSAPFPVFFTHSINAI